MSKKILAWLIVALFVLAPVLMAAITSTPSLPQTPMIGRAQIANGTGFYVIQAANPPATVTNTVAVYTCGSNGSKITAIIGTSNDTQADTITLFMVPASAIPYPITTVSVPITAGTIAATPAVNFLSSTNTPGLPVDSDGNPYLLCQSGDVIRAGVKTAVVSSNTMVTLLAIGADF